MSEQQRVYDTATAPVYIASGRRYLSRTGAITAYARRRLHEKHPCDCERDTGWYCGQHDHIASVLPRYVRWIRRGLKLRPTPKGSPR